MMRKNITRTLTRSTITVFAVKMVNGNPEIERLEPVTVWGNPTDKEALKAARDKYGDVKGLTVGDIQSTDETYIIDIDTFVANAKLAGEQIDMEDVDEENEQEGDY